MKTNPLRTYCVALLGFSPTYIHHVRGQGMRLDSIRSEANADLMWGLKVEVGRKDSGEFLMAFHLGTSEGKNAPFIAFKRCGFKIKHHFQTPVPSDEGFISYEIELEGDGKKQYIYYDPILTDKKKVKKRGFIYQVVGNCLCLLSRIWPKVECWSAVNMERFSLLTSS